MNTHPRLRRRLLVHKQHQLNHVGVLIGVACLNGLTLALLLAWFFLFKVEGRLAAPASSTFLWFLGGGLLCTSAGTVFWSLLYTRRLLGLLHKVVLVLTPMGQPGQPIPDRIRLRRDDKGFEPLEQALNAVTDRFRQSRASSAQLETELARLEADVVSGATPAEHISARLRQLREQTAG